MNVILVIGEILYDVFPDGKRLGGAPFNFAYHLQSLGLPVRFITRIGSDKEGRGILNSLRRFHFSLDTVQIDDTHPTGRMDVQLDSEGIPTFHIVPDVAYDYIEFVPENHLALLDKCNLLYFGTLAQRSACGFNNIQKLIGRRPPMTHCLYDINLRPDCYTENGIIQSLSQADVLKMNEEELRVLRQMMRFDGHDKAFMKYVREEFGVDIIALTKGAAGSELLDRKQHVTFTGEKSRHVVDTVGAGDAFTAMLAIGYLQGWAYDRILKRASEFAARICALKGAIPSQNSFYIPFRNRIAKEREYVR
jgi:fructokinase